MDYVDLYQIHRFDPRTPIEETWRRCTTWCGPARRATSARRSMFAWQFAKMQHAAERHGWTRFVSMQNHYNLVYREEEREMIPLCRDQGVGVIPWSPLARGLLAGNRGRDGRAARRVRAETDDFADELYGRRRDFDVVDRVVEVARRSAACPRRRSRWRGCCTSPASAPIVGATSEGAHRRRARRHRARPLTGGDRGLRGAPTLPNSRAGSRLTPSPLAPRSDELICFPIKAEQCA